jgi:phage terminase large subunit-like protein
MPLINDPDFTPKQIKALEIIGNNRHTLLEGGSRSGKTMLNTYCVFARAWGHPKTDHIIFRLHFSDVKQSVAMQTIQTLGELQGVNYEQWLNRADYVYSLPNGSRVFLGGTADKDQIEKHLSKEYATIYICEVSQISYKTFETLETRLNPPEGIKAKFLLDQNPTSTSSWTHKLFHERKYLDGRQVSDDDYGWLKINPVDNPHLSSDYIDSLKNLSARQRERFLNGNYQADGGTLWRREWIRYGGLKQAINQGRTVIGLDPSGSVDNDAQGLVVACIDKSDNSFVVLEVVEMHGTPNEWAQETARLYHVWNVDCVVAERNYGGDMVEATLRNAAPYMNVKVVTSTKGKLVRAEPISALYEQGKVRHVEEFPELENEECSYSGEPGEKSPNLLDAAVFALSSLSGEKVGILDYTYRQQMAARRHRV